MINIIQLLKIPVGMVQWVRMVEAALRELQNRLSIVSSNASAGSPKSYISTVPLKFMSDGTQVGELEVDATKLTLTSAWAGVSKLLNFTKRVRPAGGGTEDVPDLSINAVTVTIRELPTTGSAANIFMDGAGSLYRQTSTRRSKRAVQDASQVELVNILEQLRPVEYEMVADGVEGRKYFGFIAEDIAAISECAKRFVEWHGANPSGVQYASLVVALTAGYQELSQRVLILEEELRAK